MDQKSDRRQFLRTVAPIGAGFALGSSPAHPRCESRSPEMAARPLETVRMGFVGVGGRGSAIVRQMLRLKECQITAICDLKPERVAAAQDLVVSAGQPKPAAYGRDETDYRHLCERDDVDLVVNVTPWQLHAEVSLYALRAGRHVATETPAARTVEECWQLVEAAEKAQRHCILMENYCYFREVMCVLNMVRQGIFGEPMHVYAGYQKDALYYAFNADGTLTFAGKGAMDRVGNWYPTHFAGPSAQWLGINRGDAFDYLVSMGNFARIFNIYAREQWGPNHPLAKKKFDMSDINNTMIGTKNGRSLHLILDTRSPRPYRHYFRLQATNGIYEHIERRVHLQGRSPGDWTVQGKRQVRREWEPIEKYYAEFDHPLWRDLGSIARTSGHGGGDYMCFYRLIQALRTGTEPDIDVYDTVTWSAIVGLSEWSARNRSRPIDFPDFTRGRWKMRAPLPIRGANI